MSGSIFRLRVISVLIFSILAYEVGATPCFSDNSVTKHTQMRSKLSGSRDCHNTDSNSWKSVSEKL